MKVLIAGASGLVGQYLLQALLKDARVSQVVSVSRRSLGRTDAKLREIVLDFSLIENTDLPVSDCAYCCLGTTIKVAGSKEAFYKVDHDYVLKFASAAKAAGAKTFVIVSATGADPKSRVFYNRVKGQTESDLARLGFESLIVLQPSLLLGERKESRPFEQLFVKLSPALRIFLQPFKMVLPIEASRVAEVMLKESFLPAKGLKRVSNARMHAK